MRTALKEEVGYKDRRILIAGGAGLIGSELTRQISAQGAACTVLDNFSSGRVQYVDGLRRLTIIKGDIRNEEDIKRAMKDQEVVFNLVALPFIPDSYKIPENFVLTNIVGAVNLLRVLASSRSVGSYVHVSSSEVYGNARYVPMDENHPTFPQSTYAVTKLAAERLAFTMHKEHGFPCVILRPFNSYGPHYTQPYIVPEIICQLLASTGEVRLGNVDSTRDFTYVEDTAKGISLAGLKGNWGGDVINLGSGHDISIRQLVQNISQIMGKKGKIVQDRRRLRPLDVERLVASAEKARELLGWAPRISLEEGLRKTIDWYIHNIESLPLGAAMSRVNTVS